MAVNEYLLRRRPSDRSLFLALAVTFPLLVLVGYFRTYYFKTFFDVPSVANNLVHLHGVVMSAWVAYFVAQVALIRTKNVKTHMKMGLVGIALAAVLIVVGLATGYDSQLVRKVAPPGSDPHEFFIIPITDMLLFTILLSAAIYYRKRPAEHKSLMLLTAINFLPAAVFRMPLATPDNMLLVAFLVANGLAVVFLGWHTWTHKKLNRVFAAGVLLMIASLPIRMIVAKTTVWHHFTAWLAP